MRSKPKLAVAMRRIVAASSFAIAVPWRKWLAIQPTMTKEERSAAQTQVCPIHLLSSGLPWLCEREEKRRIHVDLGSGGSIGTNTFAWIKCILEVRTHNILYITNQQKNAANKS